MCDAIGVLVTFSLVVHVGRFITQKISPVLKGLLHRQVIRNPLQQTLSQYAVADDFLAEVVDQVGIYADLIGLSCALGPISE